MAVVCLSSFFLDTPYRSYGAIKFALLMVKANKERTLAICVCARPLTPVENGVGDVMAEMYLGGQRGL